ncbi:MAG TPA: hypothetical protein VH206_17460 [Xanthobacteraceae bacterium]|jgi:hypothetical protein|nr:hypothetical protein [Xanthobacteraceae bacterium]
MTEAAPVAPLATAPAPSSPPAPAGSATAQPATPTAADRYREYQNDSALSGHNRDVQPAANRATPHTDGSRPPADDEQKIKIGDDIELTPTQIREMVARQALEDSRRALVPETADKYEFKLPADISDKFKLAPVTDPTKGPALKMAAEWAHKKGFSQADFSEMLGVYAASENLLNANIHQAFERQKAELGAAGPARVSAIERWLTAEFGAAARPMISTIATASQVKIWETLMQRIVSQGGARPNISGRVPPDQPGMTADQISAMPMGPRLEHTRNTSRAHPMPAWRDPRG